MSLRPRALVILTLCTALVSSLLVGLTLSRAADPAEAVVGSQFNAGNIISDAVFYNSGSMSVGDIQNFLNSRVPSCRAGYTCLKNYSQTTTSQSAKVEGCSAYTGQANQSAASIIYSVAVACGINPQSLIVLLEKEQGLVSDSWPSSEQYRKAMGYACPDTSACDVTYNGFFNQVYNAAWQFKKYRYNPTIRGYQAGRNNVIQWHPNAACGSSTVYIENQATAGLYIYTPYRPNAAALNNLYGTGDSCSAYGNRNFWRIFNDWFGSTQYGDSLVRTAASPTVYLVAGTTKHAVNSYDQFLSLSPLGSVGIVPQSYLDSLQTGAVFSRLIGDSAGNLFYVDSGRKYHFDTCNRVADFGFSCPSYTMLTDSQMLKLASAGNMTSNVSTPSGGLYHIAGAKRSQAVDAPALSGAGYTERVTPLSAAAIAEYPYAAPIMREGVLTRRGGDQTYGIWYSGALSKVSASMYSSTALKTRLTVKPVDAAGYDLLTVRGDLSGLVKDSKGALSVLTPTGRTATAAGVALGLTAEALPAAVLNSLPLSTADTIGARAALKAPTAAQAYLVTGSTKQAIPAMVDLAALLPSLSDPDIITVATPVIDALANGPAAIASGSFIKSSDAAQVTIVDGTTRRPIGSPSLLSALTSGSVRTLPPAMVSSIPLGSAMTASLACPAGAYLAIGGRLYTLSNDMKSVYGTAAATVSALGADACAALPKSGRALTRFLLESGTGAVYYVDGGTKRHVLSGGVLAALGGSSSTMTPADSYVLGALATNTPIVSSDTVVKPNFIMQSGAATVYMVQGSQLRALPTWNDYLYAATTVTDRTIYSVSSATIRGFSIGTSIVAPGSVIRADGVPAVYLVDGASTRLYIGTMEIPGAIGAATAPAVVSPATVSGLTAGSSLSTRLQCGATRYIGLGGALYTVDDAAAVNYTGPYLSVDQATCATLPKASRAISRFLVNRAGDIYYIDAGTKRHIGSMARLTALGGSTGSLTAVSDYTLTTFPNGSDLP